MKLTSFIAASAGLLLSGVSGLTKSPQSDDIDPASLPLHVMRHQAKVYTLAFGREGLLASGARDNSIAIWNFSQSSGINKEVGRPERIITGHKAGVTALIFAKKPRSSDQASTSSSEILISGAADNTTRVWDAKAGTEITVLNHPRTVFGLAVAPQQKGATLAGLTRRDTEEDGKNSPYGHLATACWDGVVRIWNLLDWTLKSELSGHTGGLYAVAYSPLDSSLLASASSDRTVRIWDAKKGSVLWTLRGHKDHVTTLDWSPTEPYILASGGWDRRFHIWQLPADEVDACRSGQRPCSSDTIKPRSSGKHPNLVWHVAFAPGGDKVAACHGAIGQNPTVVIYDARSGIVVRRLGRHKDTPLVVTWSADGSRLASGGMDRQVLVYDGHSPLSDTPHWDADDQTEQLEWHQDLEDYRTGRVKGRNSTEDTAANATDAEEDGPRIPHPMNGRIAFY